MSARRGLLRRGILAVVPSVAQQQEELEAYLAKLDEEALEWEPEPLSAEYQACIDEGVRLAAIEREQGRAAALWAKAQGLRDQAPQVHHRLRKGFLRQAAMLEAEAATLEPGLVPTRGNGSEPTPSAASRRRRRRRQGTGL
eukprot:COSAG05_NODE_2896_length_2529_cov_437.500823_3_plen_141_part_00